MKTYVNNAQNKQFIIGLAYILSLAPNLAQNFTEHLYCQNWLVFLNVQKKKSDNLQAWATYVPF